MRRMLYVLGENMTVKEFLGTGGPVARFGAVVFDMFFVSVLWMIFGGPAVMLILHLLPLGEASGTLTIITVLSAVSMVLAGPATTAAHAALGKRQRHEDSYIFKDFWTSYKRNFGQALVLSLFIMIFGGMVAYSAWAVWANQALFGSMVYLTLPLQALVLVVLLFETMYVFPLLARFEMSNKDILKYGFMMSIKHLPTTLLVIVIFAAVLGASLFWNMGFSFVGVGLWIYLAQLLQERVFRNYMPEEELEADYLEEELEADPLADTTNVREAVKKAEKENEENLRSERQAIIDKYTKGRKS